MTYRGSRKHVLDWVEQPRFLPELLALARPVDCRVTAESYWAPLGYRHPDEARLEAFGPRTMPSHGAWPLVRSWWLKHDRGANTPNWDLALTCQVEGRPGLILVEAKANVPELSEAAKRQDPKPSEASRANHDHIATAIDEARGHLSTRYPDISIHRDRHYQLSNRIAFAWRLASLGIPTVLIYLGFVGDMGIRDVGERFHDEQHWHTVFETHLKAVCPTAILQDATPCGPAAFWMLSRARRVVESSPSAGEPALATL